ncbi:MAG: phosphoglycerate kinase [Candidatus Thalassarchaeaceae archaeon]
MSSVADAYVNDAFAAAHRNSPTLSGFSKSLPCFAGVLMAAEIKALSTAIDMTLLNHMLQFWVAQNVMTLFA